MHAIDRVLGQDRHRIVSLEVRLLIDSEHDFAILDLIKYGSGEVHAANLDFAAGTLLLDRADRVYRNRRAESEDAIDLGVGG